jgi:hypothetical protein
LHGGAASAAFAELIAPPGNGADPHPGGLIGLEHEYVVRDPDGVVDFRKLVRDIPLGGRRLDPGDINAQRCMWGGVVTADGTEAEVALAPIRTKPGFISRLQRNALRAREELRSALPRGLDLTGYSTHLSFAMPRAINEAAARLFLSTFAPGVMLLADRTDSPGLLVRPRPGRLELAFEYVDGAQLRGVAAYATGAAMATAAAVSRRTGQPLPPMVRAFGVPTGDRYGWGLTREAFGPDLLEGGRGALLRGKRGRIGAQEQLEASWDIARAALAGSVSPQDVADADALVAGRSRLPSEGVLTMTSANAMGAIASWPPRSPYGEVLRPRERPGFTITAEVATWDTTVFAVSGHFRRAYASVPRASLPRFLRSVDTGRLDGVLSDYLEARPEGRRLASWSDAVRPGLFDALGPATLLVATETIPSFSGLMTSTGRPGKYDEKTKWVMPPYWPLIAIGILIIGILIGIATRGPGTSPTPTPTASATVTQSAPGAQPTPAPPRVTHFTSTFSFPITTYTVEVTDPAGGGLKYNWTKSNPCGTFTFNGPVAQWSHPDSNQPGACPPEPVHPGAITVTATDVLGRTASYTWTRGSDVGDVRP